MALPIRFSAPICKIMSMQNMSKSSRTSIRAADLSAHPYSAQVLFSLKNQVSEEKRMKNFGNSTKKC